MANEGGAIAQLRSKLHELHVKENLRLAVLEWRRIEEEGTPLRAPIKIGCRLLTATAVTAEECGERAGAIVSNVWRRDSVVWCRSIVSHANQFRCENPVPATLAAALPFAAVSAARPLPYASSLPFVGKTLLSSKNVPLRVGTSSALGICIAGSAFILPGLAANIAGVAV